MEKRGEAQVASVELDDDDDEILPFWGSKRKNAGKTAPDGRREKRERERVDVEWVVQLPYGFALRSSTCSLVIRLFRSKPRLSRAKPGAGSVLVTIPLTSLAKHLAHLRRRHRRPSRRLATCSLARSFRFPRRPYSFYDRDSSVSLSFEIDPSPPQDFSSLTLLATRPTSPRFINSRVDDG